MHFIEFFVVEMKRLVGFTVNVILTANLRPALEQGCRKQTPSARKFFFRVNLLYVPDMEM